MSRTLHSDGHISSTSEYFAACLDFLGMTTMTKVCRRKQAQIYKYAKDTAHTDESYQNPADLLRDLFKRMEKLGQESVSRDLVRILAHDVGLEVRERVAVVADKATVHEEIVDDHPVLSRFYGVLTEKAPTEGRFTLVEALADDCKREIDEDVARYKEEAR